MNRIVVLHLNIKKKSDEAQMQIQFVNDTDFMMTKKAKSTSRDQKPIQKGLEAVKQGHNFRGGAK